MSVSRHFHAVTAVEVNHHIVTVKELTFYSGFCHPAILSAPIRRVDMDARQYQARFDNIRTSLDWSIFEQENWAVEKIVLDKPEQLRSLKTAFVIRFGVVDPTKWTFSRRMYIKEAARRFGQYIPRRQQDIAAYRDKFLATDGVVRLEVPTFKLTRGRQLLLDGNHRVTALALSGKAFALTLYSIVGPKALAPR